MAEFHGVCPGWVAVIVTLPSFKPVAVYPSVALPPKTNHGGIVTVEGEGGKSGVCSDGKGCGHAHLFVRYRLEGKDLSTTKGWLGVLVVVGGYQLTDKGVYRVGVSHLWAR